MSDQQLLIPRYVVPIRPARSVLEGHAVVTGGGKIQAVLPLAQAREQFPGAQAVHLPEHALLPGFVNMHTHSPMTLMRGYADDLPLDTWLKEHIWPAEGRWVSESYVRQGTNLAMAEMLRGGVTCFNEQYFFPEVQVQAVQAAGMRACIGLPVIDVETPWASGINDCLQRAASLARAVRNVDEVSVSLSPHAPYTVDDDGLLKVRELSLDLDLRIDMHVLEIAWEIKHSRQAFGEGVLERLQRLELLDERFIGVHMVHLDEQDRQRYSETGAHVVHCPESNLKLASGISPVKDMLELGINVTIGTDGAASNNNLDLLAEVRTAALLAKGASGDSQALDAWQALDMLTINGARALGLEKIIGTLEPGKQADLCAIDLSWPETQPVHHVHSQLVYAANSRQVTDVWVAGRRLLDNNELTTLDLPELLDQAREWQQKLGDTT